VELLLGDVAPDERLAPSSDDVAVAFQLPTSPIQPVSH
jgi:hypothetical protein